MRTTGSPIRFPLTALLSLGAVVLLAVAVSARSSFFAVPTTFGQGAAYSTGSSFNVPRFHAVGDLNGDGVRDAVVSDGSQPTQLRLLMGTGGGGFSSPMTVGVNGATDTWAVVAADVDQDGDVDIVTANNHSANVSVLHNAGGGTFMAPTNYPVPGGCRTVAVGDLNADGVMDLVAGNTFQQVFVFLGKPTAPGFFTNGVMYTDAGNNRQSIVIADVTGDGKPDVLAGNRDSSDFSVFPGNGNGTLSAGVQYGTGATPGTARGDTLVVKDFNGDGRLDVVAPGDNLTEVVIYLNQGGTFGTGTSYPAGGIHSLFLNAADFNQDGNLDLVVANNQSANFSILHGDGLGAFSAPSTFPNPVNNNLMFRPFPVNVADFDGDGRMDVSMVDTHHKRLVVFLNDTVTAPASCDPGSFISGNSCALAPAGSYSPGGTATSATLCPAGTYSSEAGAAACTPAPAGSFVSSAGATSATACSAGSYSGAEGSTECTLAPAGSYVPTPGATSPSACSVGYYSNTTGSTLCTPAPAGSYVPTTGSTSATLCPAGSYSDIAGAMACTPAPAGSFVPNAGATSATACPTHYSSNAGATSCFPLDTDNDGVLDKDDAYINSNVSATVSVGACSAGVPNTVLPSGASFNDLLAAAVSGAQNHGARVSAVSALANGWKSAGLISGRDHGAIVSCVAKSK